MKFIFKGYTLFILLVILTIVSLFIGVSLSNRYFPFK